MLARPPRHGFRSLDPEYLEAGTSSAVEEMTFGAADLQEPSRAPMTLEKAQTYLGLESALRRDLADWFPERVLLEVRIVVEIARVTERAPRLEHEAAFRAREGDDSPELRCSSGAPRRPTGNVAGFVFGDFAPNKIRGAVVTSGNV
jgi:hypothetical protein